MAAAGRRSIGIFAIALLAAALLSACGDSDSTTESSSTSAQTTVEDGGGDSVGKAAPKGPADNPRAKQDADSGDGVSPAKAPAPLKVSGGGSKQFQVKGGDNSIQNYGEEADESELEEVAEIVHGFYVARVEEEWEKACSYLAKGNVEQLEQLVHQSPQFKGKGCRAILESLTPPLSTSTQRETTIVDAGSFRHEGEQGFLIYYGAEGAVYAMPLREEGGTWKVAGLVGTLIG